MALFRSLTHLGFLASAAILFATPPAALASDLPKEGTHDVTLSGAGTFKATPVGKERILIAFEENDVGVGKGILDHMTWHCFGWANIASGLAQYNGYCVITDPAGDQIVADIASDGKYAMDAKNYNGTATFTTGTGKYAGISGGYTIVLHGPEFRTAAEGTYVVYGPVKGSYKVP
jgi:hypothetical protein